MRKERLDRLLVERGLAPTRAKARALILAGQVRSDGERLDKAGVSVPVDIALDLAEGRRYVSRGAHKLSCALDTFEISVATRSALDVGASTGGFTQVLLERGAERVIALDVGRGQLDWNLRNDPRVTVIEGANARYLEPSALPYVPQLAVVDVSFISLQRVLPPIVGCLAAEGEIVALIKPQFEVGRGQVGKGGIVRDPELHVSVLDDCARECRARGWNVAGLCSSGLRGADGNQEYFVHLLPLGPDDDGSWNNDRIRELVSRALAARENSEEAAP
ncbi:MAG: TlyA family RNA methyltransferase [bacterium]|nr:TlyA family RNA methyltransferase [bacterium]